jgi:hypothetical protein
MRSFKSISSGLWRRVVLWCDKIPTFWKIMLPASSWRSDYMSNFKSNTVHQRRDIGKRTRQSWWDYMFKFLYSEFYRCSMKAPFVARYRYLYSNSVHILSSKLSVNWSYCSSDTLGKFQRSGTQKRYTHSILNVPPPQGKSQEEFRWVKETAKWWPPPPASPFYWEMVT